jgi:dynein heavy chain
VGVLWSSKGFLSLKPLGSWIDDLILRVSFLKNWIENGTPNIFWMSGFFFPQAFVTGSLQNYARKKAIAIDKLSFKFNFLDNYHSHTEVKDKP